jgi:hypothetical protein
VRPPSIAGNKGFPVGRRYRSNQCCDIVALYYQWQRVATVPATAVPCKHQMDT